MDSMSDRERWDAKYRGEWGQRVEPPDPFVMRVLDRLGEGAGRAALDLACGTGRHALELARRGWRTAAWDVSPVALAVLAERARAGGVLVSSEAFDLLDPDTEFSPVFDLVVVVSFLDRPLWSRLAQLVRPRGLLAVCTYTFEWPAARPPREFRLAPGELARGLEGFETLAAEEAGGRAGLFARRDQPGR